jgi:hypothetical protein
MPSHQLMPFEVHHSSSTSIVPAYSLLLIVPLSTKQVIQCRDFRHVCLLLGRCPDYECSDQVLTLVRSNNDNRACVWINTILLVSMPMSVVVMLVVYVYLVEI